MSHELDITNDIASFVTARKPAWHRLGTVFPTLLTAEEALREAHLADWNVRKLPLQAVEMDENGVGTHDVERFYAAARTNPVTGKTQILGTVGEGYQHVQNEEQVAFLQALVDESGAFIETAGALRGGRQVFVTCKLPQAMTIGGTDQVDLYLSALNGHDGSMAFRTIASPVRIVCANTQHAALHTAKQTWSHRHTRNAAQAIEEARQTLQLGWKYAQGFEAEAERMIQQSLADAEFEKIIVRLYGEPDEAKDSPLQARRKIERLDVIRGLYHDAATQQGIRGTNWGAYQAVGEYEDWFAKVKAPATASDADRDARRALRAIDGDGVTKKEHAFQLLRVPA